MASKRDQSTVNWKIVDDELAHVASEFKDPKFYALKHVVDILTSNNPQSMVAQVQHAARYSAVRSESCFQKYVINRLCLQLREQEQRLVTLVDRMVQGYHSGFAKSIQNYSQILHLFGDAKEQVGLGM